MTVSRDGTLLGELDNDPLGRFNGQLAVRQLSDQSRRTYTAKDATNPALEASTRLLVSATEVNVGPTGGLPGRRLRIGARGFTTGTTLYAHVVRGAVGAKSPSRSAPQPVRQAARVQAALRRERRRGPVRGPVRHHSQLPAADARPGRLRRHHPAGRRAITLPSRSELDVGMPHAHVLGQYALTACRSSALAIRKRPSSSSTSSGRPAISQRTARCSKSSSTRRRQRSSAEAAGSLEPAELPQGPVRERVAQGQHAGIA